MLRLIRIMSWFFRRRNDKEKIDDHNAALLSNGAVLLERLITSGNVRRNPITNFSAEELEIATYNYHTQKLITHHDDFDLYEAFLNRPIIVMKYTECPKRYSTHDLCFNNIAFSSQTNHKNILKLIGCCLETEIPILVFEPVLHGTLAHRLYSTSHPSDAADDCLRLRQRLKIAMEIANAVAYLHFGFQRPIVFKNINPLNILLDEHYVAKLFDLSTSEYIPEGQTHIKNDQMWGRDGFIAPEYIETLKYDEKCDVYSFGVLLLELLTGWTIKDLSKISMENGSFTVADYVKQHIHSNTLNEIIDPLLVEEESYSGKERQLQGFVHLCLICLRRSPADRPTMIDAAKQLKLMLMF